MTTTMEGLAREVVACPRWRWMLGMLSSGSFRYTWLRRFSEHEAKPGPPFLPVLDDPATKGCLLALVNALKAAP